MIYQYKTTIFAAFLFLAGCAGVSVKDVSTVRADNKADGFRYYEKSAFLIITPDGKGGLETKVEFICDTSRKRAADPYAILANNKSTLSFDKGCLTGTETTIDETPLPKAVVEAVKTVAGAALNAFLDNAETPPEEKAFPGPAIYRLSIENGAVVLRGDSRQEPIYATISQPVKKEESSASGVSQ